MIPKKKTRTAKPAAPAMPPAETKEIDRPVAARRRPATPTTAAVKPAVAKAAPRRKRIVPEAPMAVSQPAVIVAASQPAVTVSADDIRIRAYFLSLEYRGSNRNDVDFWLLAERELLGQ